MEQDNLIARCKGGEREAFNELVLKYQDNVINLAYNLLSDRDDAYDAAQETFIKVYKNIGSFRGESSFVTWIYRITSNVCKDILRKRQRQGATVSLSPADDSADSQFMDIKDEKKTPEEMLETTELQREVREALSELKAEYREVIVYCDMEQLSYEEMSSLLKCPVGTIKSRLSRARTALRNNLLK
ncbi:MAG: sigma-70 family RNA polymerase sigma factor, partial [Oscillospiraceae bacterium]